jgi:hypothetical protein
LFDGLAQIYLSAGTNALQYSSIAATTTMAFEALPLLYRRRCRIVHLLCCRSESELVLLELLLNYLLQHLLLLHLLLLHLLLLHRLLLHLLLLHRLLLHCLLLHRLLLHRLLLLLLLLLLLHRPAGVYGLPRPSAWKSEKLSPPPAHPPFPLRMECGHETAFSNALPLAPFKYIRSYRVKEGRSGIRSL